MAVLYLMFPFIALVAMLVMGVIMFILKYGEQHLNTRHFVWARASPDDRRRNEAAYSQSVSVA